MVGDDSDGVFPTLDTIQMSIKPFLRNLALIIVVNIFLWGEISHGHDLAVAEKEKTLLLVLNLWPIEFGKQIPDRSARVQQLLTNSMRFLFLDSLFD